MSKIEILKPEGKFAYVEAGQTQDVRFSFVNKIGDTYQEVFKPILCRDYFSDALHCTQYNQSGEMYGFTWNPETQKYDTDQCRLSVTFGSAALRDICLKNWFLSDVESRNDLPISTLTATKNPRKFLLEGDSVWQTNSYLLGLYTLLVRMSSVECVSPDKPDSPWYDQLAAFKGICSDKSFLTQTEGRFVQSLIKIKDIAQCTQQANDSKTGWVKDTHISKVHNYSGCISLLHPAFAAENKLAADIQKVLAA